MSGIPARWRALSLWVRDGVLAAVLTVIGQVELVLLADRIDGSRPLQHLAFAVITASLVIRRTRPLAAAVAVALGMAFQTLLGEAPAVAGFVAMLIVTYSVAQYADRRRDALLGLLAILASVQLYPFVSDEPLRAADEVGNMAIPIVIWVFARLARERLDRAVLAERAAMTAQARVREAELAREAALAAERRRIAREMHDVVGHGVTLMLLHADAAQAGLARREPAIGAALDVVLTAGRAALDDLHRILRLLREDDETAEPPGALADVDRLAADARAAGLDVAVDEDGVPRPLPAAVEATAYRVVQESLTNALKYAPGSRVTVRISHGERNLEVEVADDGARPSDPGRAPGLGLLGMRERVALFHGRVMAGPRSDGPGWRVSAVLPVPAPEPAPA
jgi:signal transduction histidine kinase